jgi:hypothetical protein
MAIYLNSYYPLCCNKKGKKALGKNKDLKPYIDGSCRREPDFDNEKPCITGLCRPGFAQKLSEDDLVIYVTNKRGIKSRKIVAVFKVIKVFDNHKTAAKWYINHKKTIPNNIMVKETKPFRLDKTHQKFGWDGWLGGIRNLKEWDKGYKERAGRQGNTKVAQCKFVFNKLEEPIDLNQKEWNYISQRSLCTQNPPILKTEEWQRLKEKANINY